MMVAVKWLVGLIVVMALLFIGMVNWPMTASRLIYPWVETYAIDDFIGVTADGKVQENLFSIRETGVSAQPVVDAANTFLATLDDKQREKVMFPVDDREWQQWANIHISTRQGVGFLEFNPAQAEAAFGLIRSGLSQRGYDNARKIMQLEGYLAELLDNHVEYGEKRYWLTIMGEPSSTEPWGWQLDGHHLVVNFFVLGDQIVMTPTFMGSEPVEATQGQYAGVRVFDGELAAGLALMSSLTDEQRQVAVIAKNKIGGNNLGELFQDNAIVPYEGLRLDALNEAQRQLAISLVKQYTGQIRAGHDEIKLAEVLAHWDKTYFAWVGDTEADAVFYYRIHSPVVMIEFDQQPPVALDGPDVPSRDHIHTVVRTPNGNDYGKDLLRQHLLAHPH